MSSFSYPSVYENVCVCVRVCVRACVLTREQRAQVDERGRGVGGEGEGAAAAAHAHQPAALVQRPRVRCGATPYHHYGSTHRLSSSISYLTTTVSFIYKAQFGLYCSSSGRYGYRPRCVWHGGGRRTCRRFGLPSSSFVPACSDTREINILRWVRQLHEM